jgi:hypothetical protein
MGNHNSKNHTGHNSRKNVMRNKTKGMNYSWNLIGSNTAELCTELTAFTRHMDGSSFRVALRCHMHVSSTIVTHVVLVLMILPKFLSLIRFWRTGPALVLECYDLVSWFTQVIIIHFIVPISPLSQGCSPGPTLHQVSLEGNQVKHGFIRRPVHITVPLLLDCINAHVNLSESVGVKNSVSVQELSLYVAGAGYLHLKNLTSIMSMRAPLWPLQVRVMIMAGDELVPYRVGWSFLTMLLWNFRERENRSKRSAEDYAYDRLLVKWLHNVTCS